ncbi:MAG: hypothetical protein QG674_32 [Patescibacteria group bacterium]|nr:hypothetical protein [Patescibacteria group bacterium]
MAGGGTHIFVLLESCTRQPSLEISFTMLNRHFFKTLSIFLLIIATGVFFILVVDYTDKPSTIKADTQDSEVLNPDGN